MKGFTPYAFLLCSILLYLCLLSAAADTLTPTQSLTDTGDIIVSAGGDFELGFFSPGNSNNRYLGIWYKEVAPLTAVWVANRETPLFDSSGVLNITKDGNLVLADRTHQIVWSSNSSVSRNDSIAQLLDTGNFVVRAANDENPAKFLWQSFDHPCDTLLPDMKLGRDATSVPERYLSSWKSADDPSRGDYTVRIDAHRYAQLVLSKGSTPLGLSGPWNGIGFSGTPGFRKNPFFKFHFEISHREMYYSYEYFNKSLIGRLVLNQTGAMQRWLWFGRNQGWNLYLTIAADNCFQYALCGPFSSCNGNKLPVCGCLEGFEPKDPSAWARADWKLGCARKTALGCNSGDGFQKYSGAKLPDTLHSWHNANMSLEECRVECLKNCSCTAYANSDVTEGGSGCLIWFDELLDIRDSIDNGQDVYIRMAASDLDQNKNVKQNNESNTNKRAKIIASAMAATGALLVGLLLVLYMWRKKQHRQQRQQQQKDGNLVRSSEIGYKTQKVDLELPVFDLATISNATDNFCFQNKLGEGGFGPVYKGVLNDGQEIAVKRLSKSSNQGLDEFKNEVIHIAKLQHRNLVRLLGCCIQGDEKMLVYEYMPNKSLDSFIFDHTRSTMLDWHERFHIINGIARGLLYLHQDSRLRIIHRDLKAGNILLDNEMNPKISDFGMARSFRENETEANTKRVVGTYGYMSPEYAVDGLYSTKSDVFSFGVLVLEIVSGKRNRGFSYPDHQLNLLGHAWNLYMESRPVELIDASLKHSCNPSEVLRSIHLGLLCVQHHLEDRPSMSSVVLFLGSDGVLSPPKQPGFYMERDLHGVDPSSSSQEPPSANKMTVTLLQPR
ncbi:G-type lectin S-receptor-like serine/threonine-protein kinase At4g27290 isoform X2 [Malania oleifera]|uniref:G-type lectin S-receptor-like serine/threonine-protein kinase At4g27290 isoform X2 n=1 Tax=Malania oleifera TaxID=397392 RepID=UPI0025AE7CA2|nr:G-type lectin S-receptor-like serine/threonine-protein kinase At4g27290 isoform X2 [Malania oleifera]